MIIFGVALGFDGRPHHQEIVVTTLSGSDPLGDMPVRILIDQDAACEGDSHDLTTDDRGTASASHVARLGVFSARTQSVAVCLPDEAGWNLAWSSRHESAPAHIFVACDARDASDPKCKSRFEK
ncbi:MAG: hypothetical protein CL908_04375 [Deltaproteobacteria bacterium]|nr:hypothetical protein [Deltaproteobacteria bacterium]